MSTRPPSDHQHAYLKQFAEGPRDTFCDHMGTRNAMSKRGLIEHLGNGLWALTAAGKVESGWVASS